MTLAQSIRRYRKAMCRDAIRRVGRAKAMQAGGEPATLSGAAWLGKKLGLNTVDGTMKLAAGTLLYRYSAEGLEVLLVHPSGNYNRRAPWSIPKGEPDDDTDRDLEATARRETLEETGVTAGPLSPLGLVEYRKSRKQVHGFAGQAPADAAPKPASWEVDQACFVPLPQARELLHPDQQSFLDRLLALLSSSSADIRPLSEDKG